MKTDLREALAAAIDQRERARVAHMAASQAAERAAGLLVEAEAALAQFADLGVQIAERRGRRLAQWIAAGNKGRPPYGEDWLPDDLGVAKRDRDRAATRVDSARAACVSLDIEKVQSEAALRLAISAVIRRVTAVALAHAEVTAIAYVQTQEKAWALRDSLVGYGLTWLPATSGASPVPIKVSDEIRDALSLERPQTAINMPSTETWSGTLWQRFVSRLADDASAVFIDEPPEPLSLAGPPAGTVQFVPMDRQEAQALAAKHAEEAAARAATPIPAAVASLIELARQRGQMHPEDAQ